MRVPFETVKETVKKAFLNAGLTEEQAEECARIHTQSSCDATNSGVTAAIPYTPVVFCAVSAVMTLIAYILYAQIVLMSACTPAPPLESEPAMVSTFLMFILMTTPFMSMFCDSFAQQNPNQRLRSHKTRESEKFIFQTFPLDISFSLDSSDDASEDFT